MLFLLIYNLSKYSLKIIKFFIVDGVNKPFISTTTLSADVTKVLKLVGAASEENFAGMNLVTYMAYRAELLLVIIFLLKMNHEGSMTSEFDNWLI